MGVPNLNPLGYLGVKEKNPPNIKLFTRDPTVNDITGWDIGDFWINTVDKTSWQLLSKAAGVADWESLSSTNPENSYEEITSATHVIEVNKLYGANRAGGVAFTLPSIAPVGTVFEINGILGNWSIAQAAGQYIRVGDTTSTTGVGGSVSASAVGDCIKCRCIIANTAWISFGLQGNLTIV